MQCTVSMTEYICKGMRQFRRVSWGYICYGQMRSALGMRMEMIIVTVTGDRCWRACIIARRILVFTARIYVHFEGTPQTAAAATATLTTTDASEV